MDSRGPLLGFGDVGLRQQGRVMPAPRVRQRRQKDHQDQRGQPGQFHARAPQRRQRQRRRHHHEDERKPVDAGEGRQAHGDGHLDPGVAQRQPGEAQRAMGRFDSHPEGRHRRHGPPAAHQDARQQREHAHVQSLDHGEQRKHRPARRLAHAAMKRQHELDPVADAEPVDHAGGPTQQETPPGPRLARHRDQQRRERHGRQPRDPVPREGEDEQRGRQERQQPVQHDARRASPLTASAM